MKSLSSRQNPLFKRVRAAIREHGEEIVLEGRKHVGDAIASGWVPISIITRAGADPVAMPAARRLQVIEFESSAFDQLSDTESPQDVIALFERPRAAFADLLLKRNTIVVGLDGIQDPGNVGTIVRLAAAFDCGGIALLPACADPFSPKAIRASAGAILSVPLAQATARDLIDSRWPLWFADARGDTKSTPSRGAILVFGSEGGGVSEDIRRNGRAVAIATSERVESLNVAASAAILLARTFEAG